MKMEKKESGDHEELKTFTVSTKNYKEEHQAPDRMTAYAQFFKKILDKTVPLSQIGQIVMAQEKNEDEPVAMRVTPTLVNLGIVDESTGALNIIKVLGKMPSKEAHELLESAMTQDRHMVDRVEALRQ